VRAIRHTGAGDPGNKGWKGEELQEDRHLRRIGKRCADQDEVTRNMGGEQSEQGDEAERVDIAGQKSQTGALRAVALVSIHFSKLQLSGRAAKIRTTPGPARINAC
jgi:hypothetical protein